MRFAFALVLSVAALVAVSAVAPDRSLMFNRQMVPPDWTMLNRTLSSEPVTILVAMKQRNLDVLEEAFWAVSTPGNPRYRQFMTKEDITTLVAPSAATLSACEAWVNSVEGGKRVINMGDMLKVETTVAVAEQLLSTEFYTFQHRNGRVTSRVMGEYSVPSSVAPHVDLVAGVAEFPVIKRAPKTSSAGDPAIVPQTCEDSYGTPSTHTADAKSSQGVIEFEGQSFAPSDLQSFAEQVNLKIDALSADHIVGNNQPSSAGVEATLDIQYAAAVGRGTENWFWLEGGQTWLYGFATHFFGTDTVPSVVSISYGWSEAAQCEQGIGGAECSQLGIDSQQYVLRVNTEFMKIGGRGVSIIVASGDSGANGRTDPGCSEKHLNPTFPAASPYVTAVGATELHNAQSLSNAPPACAGQNCASKGDEQAVSYAQARFASGGGFSNYAQRPSYQEAAVQAYLSSGTKLPPSSYFNSTGRGYPDVAAFGSNVLIFAQGQIQGVGGTSCSSPIWAGVVGLLNDASITKTGKPLGFLNPLLYKMHADNPDAFTDITVGDNHCTEDGCGFGNCVGYECAKGWDPVTGLGSPNFDKLMEYVQSL